MKILFVSAVLPYPLYSGGQIRLYNLLKRLSKKHDIHLYSFIRSQKENEYLKDLRFCARVITVHRGRVWQPKYLFKSIMGTYPLLWESYHNAEMLAALSDEVVKGKYDLIHIEPGYVWPSIPTEHRVPIVIAEHNIEHAVYDAYVAQFRMYPLRPFLSLDVAKMIKWELKSWKEAAHIITVSENDKGFISQPNVSVVPNGVDTNVFVFRPKKSFSPDRLTFLYVGNYLWMENRDAADRIIREYWPVIHGKYPNSSLRIVGPNAPAGQYFVGSVDDIQKELNKADIMLAPIRIGGGTKYKILEAMASGLPVITTRRGISGMHGEANKHFKITESAEDILGSISYLANSDIRMSMVKHARALIEKEYSWDFIAEKLDAIWNSLS